MITIAKRAAVGLAIGLMLTVARANEFTEFRTWTDSDGKTLVALFQDASRTRVQLKKQNGKMVNLRRHALSEEDKRIVSEWWAVVTDPGKVANAVVNVKIAVGMIRDAQFLGFQKGLATPIIAVYRCNYVSQGGFYMVADFLVALYQKKKTGTWDAMAFKQGGLSQMLPVHQDWRRVVHPVVRSR
ncbi:MAG: hypothetical protein HN341_15175 [Verrucomicrobia bacterium]|nr:hypothetical protein [Verrucomicrobiota bacterium]